MTRLEVFVLLCVCVAFWASLTSWVINKIDRNQ